MPKDTLDRINHVIDQAGWSDGYLVEQLLCFVSDHKLQPELLAFLKKEREAELNNGTARKAG